MIRAITVNAVAILPKERRKKNNTQYLSPLSFFQSFLLSTKTTTNQRGRQQRGRESITRMYSQQAAAQQTRATYTSTVTSTDQSYLHQHSDVGAYVNKRETRERPPFQPQIPLHHNHQPNNQPINHARTCTAFNTPLTSPHPPHLFERNTCGAEVVTPAHTWQKECGNTKYRHCAHIF